MLEPSMTRPVAAVRHGHLLLASRAPAQTQLHRYSRLYATNTQTSIGTTHTAPRRKTVTVLNDDGRVPWGQLSPAEKVARTTQQSGNFTIIVLGVLGLAGVSTLLFTDVFSPQSRTAHFNRAVSRIRADTRCTALLGPSSQITAFGEPSWSKWRRNRPLAATVTKDISGTETLSMHFNVVGPSGQGVAQVRMVRGPGESAFRYRLLALDVPGHARVYLEDGGSADGSKATGGFKLLGKRWG